MPVPPAETMSPPTSSWAREQLVHAAFELLGAARSPLLDDHQVALVPHHTAHLHAAGAGEVGQPPGVRRVAAATREADHHVDQHVLDPGRGGGLDRGVGVDRHRQPRPVLRVGHRPQPSGVERLVGEQEVVAEPGGGHAEHLAGVAHVNVR